MGSDRACHLDSIVYPRSVAIVGVTTTGYNQGRNYLDVLMFLGFPKIYPVNPKGGMVSGLKVYPRVSAIPEEVDLCILTIPREAIPETVEECAEKGVKGVVIHTAGFKEKGGEGSEIEEHIIAIAQRSKTRIIGPNCMGIYNPSGRIAMGGWSPPKESGPLGMISHSGYLANTFIITAAAKEMRFSKAISCGNECDLSAVDFLEFLGSDPETQVIVAYLEGIKDPTKFFRLARQISIEKPIIVWKGGLTDSGARAVTSHTGALAVSSIIWRSLCRQTGIISVNSLEQMIDTTLAFYFLPRPSGRRVGIISGPGCFAVTSADTCIEEGLELAALSSQSLERLAEVLEPAGTSNRNPVDVGIPASFVPEKYYKESIQILAEDPEVNMILVIMSASAEMDDSRERAVADLLFQTIKNSGKSVVLANPTPQSQPAGYMVLLAKRGIPLYSDPRRAVLALSKLSEYSEFLEASI